MNVSVVIPVFNGEAFLAQTLQSALRQSLPPAEVIVVDNGSTDASPDIAKAFGEPVTLLSIAERGACNARIAGAERASGDAIMFLDADDLIAPDTLAGLSEALGGTRSAMACCPWMRFDPAPEGWRAAPPSCAPRGGEPDDLSAWLKGWYHPPCSVLWTRDAYAASGGWDTGVSLNQDGDLMMRSLIAGNPLLRSEKGTGYYRRLPSNMASLSSRGGTKKGIASRLFVLDRIARLLEESGGLEERRGALIEAYAQVHARTGEHVDLRGRCEHAIRYHGGTIPLEPSTPNPAPVAPTRPQETQADCDSARVISSSHRSSESPIVTVVIPSFNRAATLPRAIKSVLAQEFDDFEIVVVDDCSTDETLQVLLGFHDPRIRILRQPANRGVAEARNRGMRAARGRFIAFLDSDDEWLPGKLSKQIGMFTGAPPGLGLVYTGSETVLAHGERRIDRPVHRGNLFETLLLRNVLHGAPSNALMRREVVDTVGFFDSSLPAIEDYDYWTRIARFFAIDFVSEPLARYYDLDADASLHDERRSLNFSANLAAREMFFARYAHEMQRCGIDHLFLLDSARRHLDSRSGAAASAARLVARAIKRRPTCWSAYPWIALSLLPRGARERARATMRRSRAALNVSPSNPLERRLACMPR